MGKCTKNYADFISIETEHVKFAVRYPVSFSTSETSNPIPADEPLKAGKYYAEIGYDVEEGYYVDSFSRVYINGELFDGYLNINYGNKLSTCNAEIKVGNGGNIFPLLIDAIKNFFKKIFGSFSSGSEAIVV